MITPTPVPLPDLTTVITHTTTFISSWTVFISAGLVVGLGAFGLRRLMRSGR